MNSHDVIVLGLGGMGSAAAYHLAARGKRVLGLEQFTSPHDRGASHGATRVIRQSYFEHPSYVPLLLRAYELWRELERHTGKSLLQRQSFRSSIGLPQGRQVIGRSGLHRRHKQGIVHAITLTKTSVPSEPPCEPTPSALGLPPLQSSVRN